MAHLYHSQAFILEIKKSKEKDLVLVLFSEQFGLIRVMVKSARDAKSKLRLHCRTFGMVYISLVKGKEMWRVVGVEDNDMMTPVLQAKEKLEVVAKIFALIKRLVNGEEENRNLFIILQQAITVLQTIDGKSTSALLNLECVTVLRVLNLLGYLRAVPLIEPFVASSAIDEALIASMEPVRLETVKLINKTFYEADV